MNVQKSTIKILLVEDNPDHAELATAAFNTLSMQDGQEFVVTVARTGEECLQFLDNYKYDALVLDYSLSGMDGIEVLRQVHNKGVRTPVVIVTGRGDEKIAVEAIKKGAYEYIIKDHGYLERLPLVVQNSIVQFGQRLEKERLEEELRTYQIELEMSKRLASIGEMAARIAHEIKNPLSKIRMGVDFLKRSVRNSEDSPENAPENTPGNTIDKVLEGIVDGVNNLNRIAIDLLNYAKPPALTFHNLSIHEVLDTCLSDLKDQIDSSGVLVIKEYNRGRLKCQADGVRLKEVFLNLIVNAVEAMPCGGTLRVSTSRVRRRDRRFIEVSIRDTGEGIKEENLGKVFAPFFTTKKTGTGLGLAVVKKIIESHDGRINIGSDTGTGTVVTVQIPEGKND